MSKVTGVILLEGPDGAGKTTLAEDLCKRYDGHYVHRTYWKGIDIFAHHTEALQAANERAHEQLVVIDRLWPSAMIYDQVYRAPTSYSWNCRPLERVLHRMAAVTLLCVPQSIDYITATHAARAQAGGEMYPTVRDVAIRYVDWVEGSIIRPLQGDRVEQQTALGGVGSRPDTYRYDVLKQGSNLRRVGDEIVATLEQRRAGQFSFALCPQTPNVLGHAADARYLFVGEQVGDLHGWSRWPFYAKTHSPEFINKSLHRIAWPEELGLWTNAWDEDNRLPFIYERRPDLKVIALGRKAEKRCKDLKIPVHSAVPHPSYARRFNHHGDHARPYHQLLEEALYEVGTATPRLRQPTDA